MGDFDKVYIVPQHSTIEHGDIALSTILFDRLIYLPILSSPMDTITEEKMMISMANNGAFGFHHRYCDYEVLRDAAIYGGIAVSPSMDVDKIMVIMENSLSKIVILDVAHGDTKRNLDFCSELIKMGLKVISGNICTPEAAENYLKIGVNYLRVGIGSGSVCTTRTVTGVGIPQYIAIPSIKDEFNDEVRIISDGGHKTTGDICKALALGADFVMLGGMFANTKEAAGGGYYSGMASKEALKRNKKIEFFVEGKTKVVHVDTNVSTVLGEIRKAILAACYYTGSRNIEEMHGEYALYD